MEGWKTFDMMNIYISTLPTWNDLILRLVDNRIRQHSLGVLLPGPQFVLNNVIDHVRGKYCNREWMEVKLKGIL